MILDILDKIRLLFVSEKKPFLRLKSILGFYPHNIRLYQLALMHKSVAYHEKDNHYVNNERLEFLGDAILDAIVGHIVYRQYEGKREGFLTNTRSKLVSRETLGKLANEMGLSQLLLSAGRSNSHNSYVNGNAFEALVGAIYLDRGYDACMWFWENRVLGRYINLDKVAFKEVNFKSKLLEWSQKNKVRMEYRMLKQKLDDNGSPVFSFQVVIEGVEGERGSGYSKKEAQQNASKETLQKLKREPQFVDAVFKAKSDRTKMEEEPTMLVPDPEKEQQDFIIEQPAAPESSEKSESSEYSDNSEYSDRSDSSEEFDLSDISHKEKSREDIIAEAEAAAFAED